MIEGMSPVPAQNSAAYDPTRQQKEEARLKEAVQQYEQVFLKQLFSEMRKSIPKTEKESQEKEMFEGMLDEERAKAWSQGGGIGLADLMYQQLKNKDQQS